MKSTFVNCWLGLTAILLSSAFTLQAQVTAYFTAAPLSGCRPLRVEFTNQSLNSIEWDWDFGDGQTSFDENPVHYYLQPGIYSVTLRAYGMGSGDTITKTNLITVTGFSVTDQIVSASCGLSNGSIDLTLAGTAPPVTYSWTNGATTEDLNNLVAGNYRVTINDGSGCQYTETYVVGSSNNLVISGVKTNVSTPGGSDGSINITVSGGTAPYTYSWNNGATTEDLTNLPIGNYCVLVTDDNGCLKDGCFSIEQPTPCADFEVNAQITDAVCGSINGSIDLTVTGGTPPYSYAWSNGSNDQDLSNLSSGSYRVTVEDNGGCRFTETFIVGSSGNITISGDVEPVVPGVHLGLIELTVTGGTQPYSYSWSNGETGSVVDGLAAGTYCVTVADANGCSADKCFLIETAQGCNIAITGSVRDAAPGSANGRIEPFVSGGTAPYTYSWSNGSNDRIIAGLSIGTYCLTVTDANACTADHCFVVETANPGCNLTLTGMVDNLSAPGAQDGSITLTVSGGTSPYTYSWFNGETSRNIDNLSNGQYCVTVTDVNGCVSDKCFVVEIANLCDGFTFTQQITNASCGAFNGSINLIVSGGTRPYTYTWTNGSTDEDLINLAAGNYRFTATDANGCDVHETLVVSNSNNNLSISADVTDISAPGALDGSINLTITGGTPPYTFNWTHGATTEDLSNLERGTYCVLVIDANGCTEDGCFNVEGGGCGDFNITGNVGNVPCGGSTGYIDITVSFGTPPYFYNWSNGAQTEDLFGVAAGTYTVTVEDNGSCRKVKTFTVGYAGGFQITGDVLPSTDGTPTGGIAIYITGGTPPYAFQWSNGVTTQNNYYLTPGQYCVLVTDSNGCVEDKCFTVGTSGGCSNFYVTPWDDIYLCEPGNVTLEANAYEGALPYAYSWSSGSNDRITQVQVSTTTSFVVTAEDDNGCTATDTVTVFVVNPNGGSMGVAFDSITICRGDSVQLAAFGGTSYYWDPGNGLSNRYSATPWASPEETKNYWVRISDGACSATFYVLVEVDDDCVWPGDANSDGIANNQDVLAIGIGNGISGFARSNATSNWEGQFSPDWFLALASGANLKHVDCNGDATINAADTLPIFQNYGFTHNRGGRMGQKFVDPELYFDLPDDTALAGQRIDVPVYLGSSNLQVSNFYGIAFSVNYDNTIVEENTMSFAAVNSFAGSVGDLLSFDYDIYGEQKMDVALTRLNRISVSGYGQIGVISFTMKDDISGKDFLVRELALSFSDVRAIDNNENEMALFYENGFVYVKQEVSGIGQPGNIDSEVSVYPNPVAGVLNVVVKGENEGEIWLMDVVGKVIARNPLNGRENVLDLSRFPNGNYLLKIKLAEGETVRKITVACE